MLSPHSIDCIACYFADVISRSHKMQKCCGRSSGWQMSGMQVTQKVPMLANNVLQGIPTTLDVKGLELNISLAGTPCLTYL